MRACRHDFSDIKLTRRELLIAGAITASVPSLAGAQAGNTVKAGKPPVVSAVSLTINGRPLRLDLDTRTTLLDALRENLHLTGTRKGCGHAGAARLRGPGPGQGDGS